jgi:energy-coupling factor transporter ATP-binding protein EcfA2
VQLLWFLPTLIYALVFVAQGANPAMLFGMLGTAVITALVRWRMSLRFAPNQDTELRVIDSRVWLDDRRLSRRAIFWTKEQNKFIFERLSQLRTSNRGMQLYLDGEFGHEKLQLVLGFDANNLITRSLERDGPHTILVGPTGSGKTVLLNHLLRHLIASNRLELYLLDFKGGTGLSNFAAFAVQLQTDRNLELASELVDALSEELRLRETGKRQCSDTLIVVDELAHLLAKLPKALEVLSAIAARGRAFGMYLMLTNQTLVGVPRLLLSNLRLRILVGDADPVDAAMLGQSTRVAALPGLAGFGSGRCVSHLAGPQSFYFALPRAQCLEPQQSSSEHLRRLGSTTDRRDYSNQAPRLRQRHRHRASRGSRLLERTARSR